MLDGKRLWCVSFESILKTRPSSDSVLSAQHRPPYDGTEGLSLWKSQRMLSAGAPKQEVYGCQKGTRSGHNDGVREGG